MIYHLLAFQYRRRIGGGGGGRPTCYIYMNIWIVSFSSVSYREGSGGRGGSLILSFSLFSFHFIFFQFLIGEEEEQIPI